MAVVKFAEAGFAVTSQEIKKENCFEVKLRKGVELDEDTCKAIASRISPKYHGGMSFEGGITLVFEKLGDSNAHLLGIALEKEGVIKSPKLGILKSGMLVGHPAVTHYNITYALPDDAMREKLEKAAGGMPSFRMEVVKKPMLGKINMKLDGEAWVGEARERVLHRKGTERQIDGVRKLEVRKEGENLKLRVELKSKKRASDVEYTLVPVGKTMRLTGIHVNKPQWAEGVEIKPHELRKNLKELTERGDVREIATGSPGVNLIEVKEIVKSSEKEVVAKYSLTEKGTLFRVDLINGDEVPPLSIRPNKLRKQVKDFFNEEIVHEWFVKKEAVK
jgi:hypothetical protein